MALDPDTLRRAPAFAALPEDARKALALCFRGRRYAPGEVVFREGDPASSLFFIAEGEVALSVRSPGGATRQLQRLGKGQLVGESALVDPTPRRQTLTATRPAWVYGIGDNSVEILRRNAVAAARALTGAAIVGLTRGMHQLEQRVERELERMGPLP